MNEPLITVTEVARMLSMSRQWVYKQAELGSLPCVRLGASLRFRAEDVRDYLERQLRRSQASKGRVLPFHVGDQRR